MRLPRNWPGKVCQWLADDEYIANARVLECSTTKLYSLSISGDTSSQYLARIFATSGFTGMPVAFFTRHVFLQPRLDPGSRWANGHGTSQGTDAISGQPRRDSLKIFSRLCRFDMWWGKRPGARSAGHGSCIEHRASSIEHRAPSEVGMPHVSKLAATIRM